MPISRSTHWVMLPLCGLLAACSNQNRNQSPAPAPPAPAHETAPAPAVPPPPPLPAVPPTAGFPTGYKAGPAVQNGGSLTGTVSWAGAHPALPPLPITRNAETCGTSQANPRLLIDAKGGVANGVVWLEDVKTGGPVPAGDVKIDQHDCAYTPHVTLVGVGSHVTFVNSDAFMHNVHAYDGAAPSFNFAQPIAGQQTAQEMSTPGIVTLRCDVHPNMNAFVVVEPTPYFAVTGADGKYAIAGIPAGTYAVHLWHEGWQTTITADKNIQFGAPVEQSHAGVKISAGKATHLDFTLSAATAAKK